MSAVITRCESEVSAYELHTSAAVESIVRGIYIESAAVDKEVAFALPCCASRIVQTYRLYALSRDIGLVGIAVHSAASGTAAGESPAALIAACSRAGACVIAALICVYLDIAAVHDKLLLSLNAVSIGSDIHCSAVDSNNAVGLVRACISCRGLDTVAL